MTPWAARLLPAALGLTLGCSSLMPALSSPAEGGPPWTEVRSEHFVVWTDLDHDEGREALTKFEEMYTALEDIAFPSTASHAIRLNIVLFAREKDYFQFAPEATTALFVPALPNDLDEVPTMLMFGGLLEQTRLTFQHELTHVFIRQSLGWAPPWLHEGLAEYYSTLRLDGGFAYIGEPLPHRGVTLGGEWRMTRTGAWDRQLIPLRDLPEVERLIRADAAHFYAWARSTSAQGARQLQSAFYCGAWGLTHFFLHGPEPYRRRFDTYLGALARGEGSGEAWEEAFGDVPQAVLELGYRDHLRSEKITATAHRTRYVLRPRKDPRDRALSVSEVHLLWSRLRPWVPLNADVVWADLEAARAYAPDSPEVRFWRGRFLAARGRPSDAERELMAAVDARPEDALYLLGLARLYKDWTAGGEATGPLYHSRLAAVVGRLAKVATSANALDMVASFHADRGTAGEGIGFARRAIEADPTCYRCMDTYARLLFQRGKLNEAVIVQERALSLVPPSVIEPEMRGHLRSYKRALEDSSGDSGADAPAPEGSK